MILSVLIFAAGIVLLVGGAWLMVGGGIRIGSLLRVPSVVVGLTVVAFGTSAPELFVSLMGTLGGNTGLVLGNVIGSNVANLGLILAAAALFRPVSIEAGLLRREVPLMVAASLLMTGLVWDGELSRVDAAVLCVGFLGFMTLTLRSADRGGPSVVPEVEVPQTPSGRKLRGLLIGAAMVTAGVVGLAGGGQLIVDSALDLARRVGISETVIGLTLVAVGTSLPELATTVMAAARRQDDIAVGNIVGSNLFNILAVAGPVGLVRPLLDTSGHIRPQLVSMMAVTLLAAAMIALGRGSLGRGSGAFLLLVYAAVMVIWTLQG